VRHAYAMEREEEVEEEARVRARTPLELQQHGCWSGADARLQ
jgi:hypothetical protein